MIRGINASRTGMAWEQNRAEVVSNNVANVNTDGFRRSVAVASEFGQILVRQISGKEPGQGQSPAIGPMGRGVTLTELVQDQTAGALDFTGNPLDVALSGPGEFTYLGPAGPAYTRDGLFHRDSMGQLVTEQGYPVLVGGMPVGFRAESLRIESGGMVVVDGQPVGRLDLRGGQSADVVVGALERSNVTLATEMTDLITALRSFQANQRALQMQDETLGKATAEIGRLG